MNQAERKNVTELRSWAKQQLEQSVAFWLANGIDKEHGGIYTCLDRKGEIYSTDKSVWMQGRCAWMFAHLCNVYGERPEWREAARSCLDFMEAHCINRAAGDRMYFQVTAEGKPLRQRRYCFSEAFYTIANAEYYKLTGEEACLDRARRAYRMIYELNHGLCKDPTGFGPKGVAQTRTGRALADPMIFLNLSSVMREADPDHLAEYDTYSEEAVREIFDYHRKPELHCTLETVGTKGEFWPDVTPGRVVNPGHDIECSWFLMEYANHKGDAALHADALALCHDAVEAGWDKEYGGLLYFVDCLGKPTEAYEHDMKLWWPHCEMLIACAMAYRDTGESEHLAWLQKVADYCKTYFVDDEYSEWYGYLRRDGKPTQPATKGSTFKGPFHLPRALVLLDTILEEVLQKAEA